MNLNELQNIISQGENETVEFKQSFSKTVIETLAAFSNTKGGQVLIGINNNGVVKGVSISEETVQKWLNEVKQNTSPQVLPNADIIIIHGKTVVVISVIEYPVKPVSFKDKYYKRVLNSNHRMSLTEIANEHFRSINESWDYSPDLNHNLEHISIAKIKEYINSYERKNNTKVDYSAFAFLNKLEILRNNKLTYGAYLLFAKEHCLTTDIQVGRFKTDVTIIDTISLNTDLFTELNEIIAFIKKHLMVEIILNSDRFSGN
jgi:ATP-dependent DNA helicase RecG